MGIKEELQSKQFYDDSKDLYRQIVVSEDVSKQFDINKQFNIQIKTACEKRLSACWEYTRERIARINQNLESYHTRTSLESTDTITQTSLMTVRDACEDWIDIYYQALLGVKDAISIVDDVNKCESEIEREFEVDPNALSRDGIMRITWQELQKSGKTEEFSSSHTYSFGKPEIVKSVTKALLSESGMYGMSSQLKGRNNLEALCYQGVVAGMFALMNTFEPENDVELISGEQMSASIAQKTKFKFNPVDARSLIFPKSAKMPWFAHTKTVQFSDLIANATDEDGNQNQNSMYSLDRLSMLANYIRDNRAYPSVEEIGNGNEIEDEYQSDCNLEEMHQVDCMITVWEFHYVPIVFPGEKNPSRSLITAVTLEGPDYTSGGCPSLFVIGARKTPFIFGLPLHITNFAYNLKTNDPQGIGLPEVIEEIASRTQKTVSHIADLITRSLKGIHFVDDECIGNRNSLENLKNRDFIPVKNTAGRPISSVIQSWVPETSAIQLGMSFLDLLKQTGKSISRSGLSGESIKSGVVSATEFQSVKQELDKQTARPVMRVAGIIEEWITDMYRYSAMYSSGKIGVVCKGKRYFDEIDQADKEMGARIDGVDFEHNKSFTVSVEDWFVNGIGFSIKSLTNQQSEAIAKQQAMDAISLILGKGLVIDPMTGRPIIITDEDGKKLVIDIKSIVERALRALGYDAIFMPAPAEAIPPQGLPGGPSLPGQEPGIPPTAESSVMPVQNQFPTSTIGSQS